MPNKTYELRNLYFQQSLYSAQPVKPEYPSLLQWPSNGYFENFMPDAKTLEQALAPVNAAKPYSVADQVFGHQKQLEQLNLTHLSNLFYERCRLHKQHIQDILHRHLEIQEKKFGVEINKSADSGKRLSGLESQLLQLEQEQRNEELAFWKDTVDLREKLFEKAALYGAVSNRYSIFSGVEQSDVR